MGEVGANSAESPHVEFKMNGGVNGTCDDERMDVDSQNGTDIAAIALSTKDTTQTAAADSKGRLDIDEDVAVLSNASTDIEPGSIPKADNDVEMAVCLVRDGDNNDGGRDDSKKDSNQSGEDETNGTADPLEECVDAKKSSENGTIAGAKQPEPIESVDEVHAISDSDDDNDHDDPLDKVAQVELSHKSNGVAGVAAGDADHADDDKAVSIHSSDSESEEHEPAQKSSNDDDEEDCVVIEDDKRADGTARPVNRARKSAVRPRDYDDDIEEIIDDPLEMSSKKPRLMDPLNATGESQQAQLAARNSKEPSLMIIDTNSILSRGNAAGALAMNKQSMAMMAGVGGVGVPQPHGLPYPNSMPNAVSPFPNINQMPILSALTDDMFVLEAPSFIVPYIYEKPATENLRSLIEKLAADIEESSKHEQERPKAKSDKGDDADAKNDDQKTDADDKQGKKSKQKKPAKSADDSWDEMDTSTDDEASDAEENRVLIKEAKADLDAIKPHIIGTAGAAQPFNAAGVGGAGGVAGTGPAAGLLDEKADNYFESPIGKFFMDIGISLVQEHVQTDLLRQQKRKLHREGEQKSPEIEMAIKSLMKNLEQSKNKNTPFKYKMVRCEHCNYNTESKLILAYHYETPHEGPIWRCSYCEFTHKDQPEVLIHMKSTHTLHVRLKDEKTPFQCTNCMYEDQSRAKVTRHSQMCNKKFRPEVNLTPPVDWDPPAKIPRIKPRHGLVGTANAYQAMASQRITTGIQRPNLNPMGMNKNRGRPQNIAPTSPMPMIDQSMRGMPAAQIRPPLQGGVVLPNNYPMANPGQYIQVPGTGLALLPNVQNTFNVMQPMAPRMPKSTQQPSISITAVPKQSSTNLQAQNAVNAASAMQQQMLTKQQQAAANAKPGQVNPSGKFVICEICDGLIKDLDQLRNHMQWMHKVKIHPKMIYNRPPLNCQKCQFRFFTDQGLERHLLGSHGLVTSSMQDAANRGKDAGRCPVCGKMYQWKLLNHVSREHGRTLKPAHLSYKCTVCTATFGMYKQFETHVYSAHSGVAKKSSEGKSKSAASSAMAAGAGAVAVAAAAAAAAAAATTATAAATAPGTPSSSVSPTSGGKKATSISGASAGTSLLKQPFKINDEITITPQPAARPNRTNEIESHVID